MTKNEELNAVINWLNKQYHKSDMVTDQVISHFINTAQKERFE